MANTDFTPRMKQIILALLANQGPVPVQKLAEQVHISKRTVQRELEYFPRALKKYDIAFCSKTGTGVWVRVTPTIWDCRVNDWRENQP